MKDHPHLLYLSRADVEAARVTMPEIIERLEAAFLEKGAGRTEMPPKPGIHPGPRGSDNFIHAMPASIPALGAAGVKWVSGFPGNPALGLPYISGLLILNDPATGLPTAVAVKRLARRDASSLAILGCGVQGRTNLEAVASVLPALREVRAYDIHPDRVAGYIKEMGVLLPRLRYVTSPTPRAAVEGADVVVTAGPIRAQPTPSIEADWFSEGALGVPLDYDSYWKPEALARADRFYTDDTSQMLHTRELGVHFQRIPEVYADLGQVIAGVKDGRRTDRERLVCMNMGIALDDMATAPLVLERARARRLGTTLPL